MSYTGDVTSILSATCDALGNAVIGLATLTFRSGEMTAYSLSTQKYQCGCCGGGGGGCTCCCINLDAGGTGCCDNAGVVETASAVGSVNQFCQTNGGACVTVADCIACNTNPPTRSKSCNNSSSASTQPCLEIRDCTNVVCSSCSGGNCSSTGTYSWTGPASGCTPPGGGC